MRSLEIRTQRIFDSLIKQNQKLGSESVLKQARTVSSESSVQSPESRVQRPTLATRVQEFQHVLILLTLVFNLLMFFFNNIWNFIEHIIELDDIWRYLSKTFDI